MKIELTKFAERQWDAKFAGTKMHKVDKIEFLDFVNTEYDYLKVLTVGGKTSFRNSVNDFCKYLYIANDHSMYPSVTKSVIKIDHTIYPYIQTGYSSRTPEELAVLSRWVSFPPDSYQKQTAEYIGLVLYTREQLLKEHNAMFPPEDYQSNVPWTDKSSVVLGQPKFELSEDCEYGIVAIMGLGRPEMDPMPPITHLRNALGTHEGGNGVPINREEYDKSVKFWSENIMIK